MKKIIIAIVAVIVLILIYSFSVYNSLVTLNVSADTQWKQVETDYTRRYDLIPNLVESVKGVMKQEQAIFLALAEARTKYGASTSQNAKAEAATEIEGALGRLLVVMENYPQLKSSEVVQTLMAQLEGTENRISVERMRYNTAVRDYNLKVMRVPSSIIASFFGFKEREYFNAPEGAENAPQAKF